MTMRLEEALLATLPEGKIIDVCIGLRWTAVVAEVDGKRRCGLASTLSKSHPHGGQPEVPSAGSLQAFSAKSLAALLLELASPTLSCVGVAATNALLPEPPDSEQDEGNAEHVIAEHGAGKRVALVGHFHFVPRLREQVGELFVIDQNPQDGDLPAEAAPAVIPSCEVVALTGMALVNHTLGDLLKLCAPSSLVMLLGPSTPLSPVLFDYGVNLLSGSLVTDIEAVLQTVRQGGNFRQVHRAGVRLVTMTAPGMKRVSHAAQ